MSISLIKIWSLSLIFLELSERWFLRRASVVTHLFHLHLVELISLILTGWIVPRRGDSLNDIYPSYTLTLFFYSITSLAFTSKTFYFRISVSIIRMWFYILSLHDYTLTSKPFILTITLGILKILIFELIIACSFLRGSTSLFITC